MANPLVMTSSDSFSGGGSYNRFKGPIFSGTIASENLLSGSAWTIPPPGAVAVLQTTAAIATQIITTTAQFLGAAGIYIPQGTVGVSSSNTATVAAAPPYTGIGAFLYFDYTRKKLSIYSTGVGDWLSVSLTSS